MRRKGYLKEYKDANGKPFWFINGIACIKDEQEQFYRERLNGNKLWNTDKPFGFHFIDDNKEKICSISIYIKRITSKILSNEFKENHFRIIKICSQQVTSSKLLRQIDKITIFSRIF